MRLQIETVKGIDCGEVDRHLENPVSIECQDFVAIVVKRSESVYIFPGCLVGGMKDMRTVGMAFNPCLRIVFRVTVPSRMVPLLNYYYPFSKIGSNPFRYDRPEKPGADDKIVKALQVQSFTPDAIFLHISANIDLINNTYGAKNVALGMNGFVPFL